MLSNDISSLKQADFSLVICFSLYSTLNKIESIDGKIFNRLTFVLLSFNIFIIVEYRSAPYSEYLPFTPWVLLRSFIILVNFNI